MIVAILSGTWVLYLVKPVLQVTEHDVREAPLRCGQRHRSGFPDNVSAPVQYGHLIKSTLVNLTQQQLLHNSSKLPSSDGLAWHEGTALDRRTTPDAIVRYPLTRAL